jgi:YgiT-type zinc finger domain-containing protein
MQCPECRKGETVRGVWDWTYSFHGRTKVIKKVEGERCPVCLDIVMTMDEAQRVGSEAAKLNRLVRAEERGDVSDSEFIQGANAEIGFDRFDARTFLDEIPSMLSRGGIPDRRSPEVLERIIEILVRHPELLAELRG